MRAERAGEADALPLSSDDLAILRTAMASDRTLMAWVRTSLSLLSFGFTIYKVLEGFVAGGRAISPSLPRSAGLVLAVAGTLSILLGIAEYVSTQRVLHIQRGRGPRRFTLLAASVMLLTGVALILGIATHFL
jgi:putative membrane protein